MAQPGVRGDLRPKTRGPFCCCLGEKEPKHENTATLSGNQPIVTNDLTGNPRPQQADVPRDALNFRQSRTDQSWDERQQAQAQNFPERYLPAVHFCTIHCCGSQASPGTPTTKGATDSGAASGSFPGAEARSTRPTRQCRSCPVRPYSARGFPANLAQKPTRQQRH